jgi:Ca2+-binding RTX toxin-like protein
MISVVLGTKAKNYDFDVSDVDFDSLKGTDPSYTMSSKGLTIADSKTDYVLLEGKFKPFVLAAGDYEKGIKELDSITVVENGKVSYTASNLDMTGKDAANGAIFKQFLAGDSYSIKGNGYANDITGADQRDVINGLGGNDRLMGHGGNDTLLGDIGNDHLVGGIGRDTMSGGLGIDTFVFVRGDGRDVITDFNAVGKTHDVIDFSGHRDVNSFDDLVIERSGSSVLIEAGHDVVVLDGVKLAEIDASDFHF